MSTTSDNASKASDLLTVVQAANTGILLWDTVGPWLQSLIHRGDVPNIPVTQDDLAQDSVDFGHDLDTLQTAIDARAKREGTDNG